jgi:acetyl esterase/lipase
MGERTGALLNFSVLLMWLNKAFSAAFEFFGRFVFNMYPPKVGGMMRGVRYGGLHRSQALDVVIPAGEGPFPVLVYIHGGGFHTMGRRSYERLSKVFASHGYLVFNADYRLAPTYRYFDQFADVGEAVRYAYEHAADFGGDSSRLFIGGDSAGGTFTGVYGAAACDHEMAKAVNLWPTVPVEDIAGLLLFYGTYDFNTAVKTGFPLITHFARGFLGHDPEEYREAGIICSTLDHLTPQFPPSILVSGGKDHLHTESVAFSKELERMGVDHEECFFPKDEFPEAFHGFINLFFLRCTDIAINRSLEFMKARSGTREAG